jgi:hypothetical protein
VSERRRWVVSLGCAAAIAIRSLPSLAAPPVPPGWEYAQELTIPKPGLVEVAIPPEALDRALGGLEDLRVVDGAGREVPYLFRAKPQPPVRSEAVATEISQSGVEDATVAVYRTGAAGTLDTITLRTPARDFIKPVTVEASDDRSQWRPLAIRYPVFRQSDGSERLAIRVAPGRYPYLRFTVGDARERPIPLTAVTTHQTPPEPAEAEVVTVALDAVATGGAATRLMLSLPARHLSPRRIALDPDDPVFSREVTVAVRTTMDGEAREQIIARGRVHRVSLAGASRSEVLSILLPGRPLAGRTLVLTIENGDSPPLSVRQPVRVTFELPRLRFSARPGERYALAVGNRSAKPPRYDLAALPALGELPAVVEAVPGLLERNPGFRAEEAAKGAPAEGAAIDRSRWRRSRGVICQGGGAQALEVPPEVLSRSPALGDVRLVAGGRQVPYILERGSLARRLDVTLETLPTDRGGRVSRRRVRLPHAGLPLEEIRCTVVEQVFRREVNVYEELPPERGGRWALGSAIWERRGERADASFSVGLGSRPARAALVVEMDDGDNAPLTVKECSVGWHTSRLLFKAPGVETVSLLYDSPDAGPPRYDLALLADELLAADAASAALAPDEGGGNSAGSVLPDGWERWALWGALTLVVAVLIVVIAKLLPAQPPRG